MHARLGGLGACFPRKFLEIRCSEIASEVILGQKQSGVLHRSWSIASNFWLSTYAFALPADFEFPREKVATKVARRASEVTSLGRQLVNFQAPEISNLFTFFACVLSLQQSS